MPARAQRERVMLAPNNLNTRLVRLLGATHTWRIFNKRKEVIRCLMVQQEARFCSFGRWRPKAFLWSPGLELPAADHVGGSSGKSPGGPSTCPGHAPLRWCPSVTLM